MEPRNHSRLHDRRRAFHLLFRPLPDRRTTPQSLPSRRQAAGFSPPIPGAPRLPEPGYPRPGTAPAPDNITIRPATNEDGPAILRLAALDSCCAPVGEVLLAFEGGELRALSASGKPVIADPFARTAEIVALLQLRASQTE
jgi:hypothetical protein